MSWLPYVVLILIGAFKDLHDLSFSITAIPIIFLDLPSIWSPLLEMIFNSNIRRNLLFIKNSKNDHFIDKSEKNKLIPLTISAKKTSTETTIN